MTLLEILRATTAFFVKRGIESPRLNAEHLLAHSLGKKRLELYLEFENEPSEAQLAPLRELVRRRANGEPLQHLVGTVEFCGRVFLSDKRALIPRPETEELVEKVKSKIENPKSKILDVGTGSGVIALSLAGYFPEAEIHGSDLADSALELARENAERLGLTSRVQFRKADLLANAEGDFDVIVANLPYVSDNDRASLSREVLHDPYTALFGGERGDELIRKLADNARSHLKSGGLLALEIGLGQAEALADFLAQKNYRDIDCERDTAGVARFLFCRHG